MLKSIERILSTISLLAISFQASAALVVTSGSVYLNADAGSWVGGGIGSSEVTWSHGVEGLFSIQTNSDKGATVTFDDGNHWRFNFAAPTYNLVDNTNDGNLLEAGFYDDATRFPFNSPTRPGLNFSGNGRGNNTSSGWFDVLEIEYGNSNSDILSLAIDFRQFDEGEEMIGASTFGSLRINSDMDLNYTGTALSQVPLPAAVWFFGSGLIGLMGLANRKS